MMKKEVDNEQGMMLNMETKYYYVNYVPIGNLKEQDPVEIKLNKGNMFFVQLDGSIRFIFDKYGIRPPKYVFVARNFPKGLITIVRGDMSEEEAFRWYACRVFVMDELWLAARTNSDEESIVYKFEVI